MKMKFFSNVGFIETQSGTHTRQAAAAGAKVGTTISV